MYPPGSSAYVVEEQLSEGLCGRSRPGHFRGVCTVVAKLLNIVCPNFIVLGEKDYQQLAVLRRMLRDLNFPVEVVPAPIVREDDGLALSSRNKYLSPGERADALCLRRGLLMGERLYREGLRDAERIRAAVAAELAGTPSARIDYVELVDAETLAPLQEIEGPALLALAVYIGRTRLIDNIVLNRP
jgi:pantoate--beta-alanine ligase